MSARLSVVVRSRQRSDYHYARLPQKIRAAKSSGGGLCDVSDIHPGTFRLVSFVKHARVLSWLKQNLHADPLQPAQYGVIP